MPKLKDSHCILCKRRILRHDANRVSIEVARAKDGNKVYKLAHLKCTQETASA